MLAYLGGLKVKELHIQSAVEQKKLVGGVCSC